MNKNNKGFTLLEVLASITIMSISMWALLAMTKFQVAMGNKITKKLETATVSAIAASNAPQGALYTVVYFPTLNKCELLDEGSGKRTDDRTVMVYTDKQCHSALGTIGALSNETYFNDVTAKLWVISGQAVTLRILLLNLKAQK